jgi:hypothetical protein
MLRIFSVFLFCAGLFCLAQAQVPMTGAGKATPAGIAYTGVGDIVTAVAGWGTEAYKTSTRGMKAINVCNVSDVACGDMSTDATTGKLALTTIGGSDCTMVTCTVKIIYDITFGTGCGGSACDRTQATIGNRATLLTNALNGVACLSFNGTSAKYPLATGPSHAQPVSGSFVAKNTSAGSQSTVYGGDAGAMQVGFDHANLTPNGAYIYGGGASVATAAQTDNSFHAVQNVWNGASSNFYIDGSATGSLNISGNGFAVGDSVGDDTGGASFLKGTLCELFLIASDATSNQSSLNTNQHSSGRWNF